MNSYEQNMNTIDNKVLDVLSRAVQEHEVSGKVSILGDAVSGPGGTVNRAVVGTRDGKTVRLEVLIDTEYNYTLTIEDRVITGFALFDQRTNLTGQINYNFVNILTLRVSEFLEKLKG